MTAMVEEWRDVPGYPGYQASDLGRIKGLTGRVLAGSLDRCGYRRLSIRAHGKVRTATFHSMVALAFIGPRPFGYDIDHIDRVRDSNAPGNLRYVTHAENMSGVVKPCNGIGRKRLPSARPRVARPARPGAGKGGLGEWNSRALLTEEQAAEILSLERPGRRGVAGANHPNTSHAIAARYGVSVGAIKDLLAGRNWKHLRRTTQKLQGSHDA